ncbi:hypothetical protein MTBBW1_1380021 [Desulfamplus magnetovallimortis]|uniref:Uncharacterized protein n=1 Tax=Desulfamplus magnetovallimortis TaxID=1246637 RepID=A0A1W1H7R1_9BACT|nr:hypothetical protein MTBBW1_1380021 [Desulfamplus magnetovallimortis]
MSTPSAAKAYDTSTALIGWRWYDWLYEAEFYLQPPQINVFPISGTLFANRKTIFPVLSNAQPVNKFRHESGFSMLILSGKPAKSGAIPIRICNLSLKNAFEKTIITLLLVIIQRIN